MRLMLIDLTFISLVLCNVWKCEDITKQSSCWTMERLDEMFLSTTDVLFFRILTVKVWLRIPGLEIFSDLRPPPIFPVMPATITWTCLLRNELRSDVLYSPCFLSLIKENWLLQSTLVWFPLFEWIQKFTRGLWNLHVGLKLAHYLDIAKLLNKMVSSWDFYRALRWTRQLMVEYDGYTSLLACLGSLLYSFIFLLLIYENFKRKIDKFLFFILSKPYPYKFSMQLLSNRSLKEFSLTFFIVLARAFWIKKP